MANQKQTPVEKDIKYDMGVKEIFCPICKCCLYDGFAQNANVRNNAFKLVNAKFCPQCGVEFMD